MRCGAFDDSDDADEDEEDDDDDGGKNSATRRQIASRAARGRAHETLLTDCPIAYSTCARSCGMHGDSAKRGSVRRMRHSNFAAAGS